MNSGKDIATTLENAKCVIILGNELKERHRSFYGKRNPIPCTKFPTMTQ